MKLFLLLSVATVFLFQVSTVHGYGSCFTKLKNYNEIKTAMSKCKKEVGAESPSADELRKNGYEDKCLMKCVIREAKYAKSDGSFDIEKAKLDFKNHADAKISDAMGKLLSVCDAQTSAQDQSIVKDPCKSIAYMKLCLLEGENEIC